MTALVLVVGVASMAFGEVIDVRGGFGWDGDRLGRLSADFPNFVHAGAIDFYQAARVGPSAVVHAALILSELEPSRPNVVALWQGMNLILLLASSALWTSLAGTWRLSSRGHWVGFAILFGGFHILKMSFFCPVLTDTAGFTLGLALLVCAVQKRAAGIVVIAVVSAFVWPTNFYAALALLVANQAPPSAVPVEGWRSRVGLVAATALTGGLGAVLLHADDALQGVVLSDGAPVWRQSLWMSIPLAAAFVGVATLPLIRSLTAASLDDIRAWAFSRRTALAIATAVVLIVAARTAHAHIGTQPAKLDSAVMVLRIIYESVTRPLAFLVAHVAYFGPSVMLAVLVWPRAADVVRRCGPGVVVVTIGALVLSLGSESRGLMNFWPFFAAFTACAIDELDVPSHLLRAWALWSVVASRIWLPINGAGSLLKAPLAMPAQHYFMSFGPWMADNAFLAFAAVASASGAFALALLSTSRRPPAADR